MWIVLLLVGVVALVAGAARAKKSKANPYERAFKAIIGKETDPMIRRVELLTSQDMPGPFSTIFSLGQAQQIIQAILDAATRSLWQVAQLSPPALGLRREPIESQARRWIELASGVLLSWSNSYRAAAPGAEELYRKTWGHMTGCYTKTSGFSLDPSVYVYFCRSQGRKSDPMNQPEAFVVLYHSDMLLLGNALMKALGDPGILENRIRAVMDNPRALDPSTLSVEERRVQYLGLAVWKAYEQIVQPILERAYTE